MGSDRPAADRAVPSRLAVVRQARQVIDGLEILLDELVDHIAGRADFVDEPDDPSSCVEGNLLSGQDSDGLALRPSAATMY